jgi:hypothetical protein
MNKLQICTEIFAVLADALSCWKRHILYRNWRGVKHDVRKCVIYFHEFVVSEKIGPVILVAITAHHTPPIKYVMILRGLTGVWELMYSQESKPSSTGKQNKHGIIFLHHTSHKATSSQNTVLLSLCSLLLTRMESVFVNCCPHLHDTSPIISVLCTYHTYHT